ncbi:MAG: TonB-dependent receptor [Stellaceae bacterium]
MIEAKAIKAQWWRRAVIPCQFGARLPIDGLRLPIDGLRLPIDGLRRRICFAVLLLAAPLPALAQSMPAPQSAPGAAAPAPMETVLPTVEVVAPTPLLGSGVDRAKVPAETRVLTDQDISRDGYPDALRAMNQQVPGVTLDAASGNPFQPSLFYHGFQASPLQGNAQGLAVYLNGTRFNQAFGDTVNWDLIPDIAIDRLNIVGSNPVFGLNALGGAISVQMKNGFTYQGSEFDALGGSFAKYQGQLQYGVQAGNVAAYVAANGLQEQGWRDVQSSQLRNFYGDLGWRGNKGEVHVSVTGAVNRLDQPGTSPIQQLQADPAGVFTAPNLVTNNYAQVTLSGTYNLTDQTSLQSNVYYDYLVQKVYNGDASAFAPCTAPVGFLCESPGLVATNRAGNPIPDFLNGGPYSDLEQQSTNTNGYGASMQVTDQRELWNRKNQLIAGVSFDGAQTLFSASTQIGGLDVPTSEFAGPGVTVDMADGSIAPVRVAIANAYYGAFFTDTFDITPALAANVAGRFNFAQIDLNDQLGTALTGNHTLGRFNPSSGLTWKILPELSVYASYAEANRAPTPAELTCSSAASPCSLANFLVADPDLQQVVARTWEAGVRGRAHPTPGMTLSGDIAFYRTSLTNDIQFLNSPIQGRAFFANVGSTLRQGVDLNFQLKADRLLAWIGYSYIDAQFQTGFTASSENNPFADIDGNIQVQPGDRLPGIPTNLLKLGVDYQVTPAWTVGGGGIFASGQYLFGDEANLTPQTPPYFVLNLHTSYQVTPHLQMFALLENAFNATYYTFGTFSPTSAVPIAQAPGATNPRSFAPAAPIAITVGVRATF